MKALSYKAGKYKNFSYVCFLHQNFHECEINGLWGLQETDMYWDEEFALELDNHGYFGTIIMEGVI